MASYRLVFRQSVAKDPRAFPTRDVARILERIATLAESPRGLGCERPSGQDRWRIRQGQYRLIHEIRNQELLVIGVRVGNRKDVNRSR